MPGATSTLSVFLSADPSELRAGFGAAKKEIASLGPASRQAAASVDAAWKTLGLRSAEAIRAEMGRVRAAYAQVQSAGSQSASELGRAAGALSGRLTELRKELHGVSVETGAIGAGANRMMGLLTGGAVVAGFTSFASSALSAYRDVQSSMKGLESTARFAGVGMSTALGEASKLSADGLLTLTEASQGLQNLLSRGYTVEQAVQTLTRLKDSAAFNRQASLQLGQAVVGATEGLKNENSLLVDNAGVTKNVSVMWAEYAARIGKGVQSLTQQEKIQAEVNGILRETEGQTGNAAKAAAGLEGALARQNKAWFEAQAAAGEAIAPFAQLGSTVLTAALRGVTGMISGLELLVPGLHVWMEANRAVTRSQQEVEVASQRAAASRRLEAELAEKQAALTQKRAQLETQQAAERRADIEKDIAAQIKEAQDTAKIQQQSIQESIKRRQDYARTIADIDQRILDARRQTSAMLAQAGGISQEATEADKTAAAYERLAAVERLRKAGGAENLRLAEENARKIQEEAAGLKDQATAYDLIQRSGQAVERVLKDQRAAAEKAAAQQQEVQDKLHAAMSRNESDAKSLGKVLEGIQDTGAKKFTLEADVNAAEQALAKIQAQLDELKKGATVPVQVQSTGGAGPAPGFARGGSLPGYGGGDRIHALLEAGEFIVRKEAVKRWGAGFFAALNALSLPRYVPDIGPGLPRFAQGGPVGAGATDTVHVMLSIAGGAPVRLQGARDQAKALVRALKEAGLAAP